MPKPTPRQPAESNPAPSATSGFDVVPADLSQPHLRCGDDLKDIFRTLTTGLDGTPMVSFAEVLSEEQRWDVVAYIANLRTAKAPAQ